MPNKPRIIYSQKYHKAAAMVRDPWFKSKETWLKKRFAEVGCPLPKNGFKKYKQYLAWNERYWKRYSAMEQGPEFKAEILRITGGRERFPREVYDELEQFRESFLPPVYGEIFRKILRHFNIDEKDTGFRNFLESYFFFGRKEYSESPFVIRFVRDPKTRELEMFIQIFGHTKQGDIAREWNWIAKEQKILPDFKAKNKEWETFERDIEIYDLYKTLKSSSKECYSPRGIDFEIFCQLHERWPRLSVNSIRAIVAKAKKRLGEI